MVKRVVSTMLLVAIVALMVGCAAHVHTIGSGPQKSEFVQERQWYVLWGLVPINKVDSSAMAGGATSYEIKTEQSALDVLINIFTGAVTVYSRTVTVTK